MKTITKKKWNETHKDYKLIDENGQHKILVLTEKGTCLIPVKVFTKGGITNE